MEGFKLNNDCTLTINGTPYTEASLNIDTGTCNCVCAWNERKEEKKMNEFLKIKKDQELEKNNKEYQLKKEVILKDDKIQKILKDAENEINEIYKVEEQTYRINLHDYMYHMTKENRKKIEELKKENSEKEDEIVEKYKEIEALVEDIPAKDRIEIYKMYNIM